jgi:peroxiredoxin
VNNLKKLTLTISGCILAMSTLSASDEIKSYQETFDNFMQKRKNAPSKFTKEEKKVMQDAAISLEESLPNPGIHVGEKAPLFNLKNAFGKDIVLNEELKKGPVILVFYRGAWCPYCNMYLHVLQENLDTFKKYDAQLITITPQSPDKSAKQIEKDGYPFEVLSDINNKVMKKYKLYFELPKEVLAIYKKHGVGIEINKDKATALPIPGSFVIDKKGVVRAMQAQTNYKIRMEPEMIIKSLIEISKDK